MKEAWKSLPVLSPHAISRLITSQRPSPLPSWQTTAWPIKAHCLTSLGLCYCLSLVAPPTSQAFDSDSISQVAALQSGKTYRQQCRKNASTTHGTVGRCTPLILDHHVFTKAEWKRACLRDQPRVPITISVDTSAQTRYSTPTSTSNTHVEVSAITDIGTQSDLWSMKDFLACVFSHDNLLCVSLGLSATSLSPISIEGAFFARLTTKLHNGEVTLCNSMV